jgi:sucrose phosphorylase
MPGVPLVWYLDLLAGTNDDEAADRLGLKDINRTNLSIQEVRSRLERPVVATQMELIRLRRSHPAFAEGSTLESSARDTEIRLTWSCGDRSVSLRADLGSREFSIEE